MSVELRQTNTTMSHCHAGACARCMAFYHFTRVIHACGHVWCVHWGVVLEAGCIWLNGLCVACCIDVRPALQAAKRVFHGTGCQRRWHGLLALRRHAGSDSAQFQSHFHAVAGTQAPDRRPNKGVTWNAPAYTEQIEAHDPLSPCGIHAARPNRQTPQTKSPPHLRPCSLPSWPGVTGCAPYPSWPPQKSLASAPCRPSARTTATTNKQTKQTNKQQPTQGVMHCVGGFDRG